MGKQDLGSGIGHREEESEGPLEVGPLVFCPHRRS